MRYHRKIRILRVFIFGIVFCCGVSPSIAGENQLLDNADQATDSAAAELPSVSFKTEGDYSLGYRWTSTEDSLKAAEYVYPHSSATFGLNLLSAPLPYRYHANGEFFSRYDYYLDGSFAYKDLILFRDILVGIRNNLNHYDYQLGDAAHYESVNDGSDQYYIDFFSNLVTLRLKSPYFPFHTFVNHRHVERESKIQQRFLLGYDPLEKVSESRDIELDSDAIKLGANSHLGQIEIEYTYDQSKFNPGNNHILYDDYPDFINNPPYPDRLADTYPHNIIPETESSAHTVKLHSSYTGGIVAAASFSNLFKKNNFSLTESTTWKGAFDLSWIPDPVMGLFFKYRHRDVDMDTPNTVTLTGISNNNVNTYSVRQGISSEMDVFSLSSRYRPLQRLSLFARYEFANLDRKEISDWFLLTPQTKTHSIDLRVHARPLDRVQIKALYEYKNYDQPAYNATPDKSNKIRLTTTYTPSPSLNIYLEYSLFVSKRDSQRHMFDTSTLGPLERDGRHDLFLASLTKGLTPKLSLSFSWFYERLKIEQDLVYGNLPPYADYGVPYTDKANSFLLSLHWVPRVDITVQADLTYTLTDGITGYKDVVGGAPFSLSSFSDLETSETSFSLDIAKKLPKDWEIGLGLYFNIFNDKPADRLDGNVLATTFNMKRYF